VLDKLFDCLNVSDFVAAKLLEGTIPFGKTFRMNTLVNTQCSNYELLLFLGYLDMGGDCQGKARLHPQEGDEILSASTHQGLPLTRQDWCVGKEGGRRMECCYYMLLLYVILE
jgi:hypothetical protein